MVGKPVPPKTPPKEDTTYKLSGETNVGSPVIVQGAASAAAGSALRKNGRDEIRGSAYTAEPRDKPSGRLVSLDAFRGFIMIMLAATGFGIAKFADLDDRLDVWKVHDHEFWNRLAFHFGHPDWRSAFGYKVAFWDLIQPAFMFMVGVAMPFSYARRSTQQQHSTWRLGLHALIRSIALILIGVFLQSNGRSHTTWEFPNVLCQIGFGYFFAWCLLNFRPMVQGGALIAILVGYWALFFFNPPPTDYDYSNVAADAAKGEVFEGKFAAWSKNANTAFYFDRWLLPKLRTVPDEDSPSANDGAALQIESHWQPVVVMLPQETATKELDATTPETVQTPTADDSTAVDPAAIVPAGDNPPADTPSGDPVPAADSITDESNDATTAESASPPIPSGPGWFRRTFLRNDVPWKPNPGGYATLSFIPSIGTMLLGMLSGQLLIAGGISRWSKLGLLIAAAGVCLGLGILADITVCPIVKRIWTPSWVLFSGGYVIGMLALFYFLFDIAPLKSLAFPLVVVGMNSILMYMLGQTLGGWTRNSLIQVHLAGMIESLFGPKALDPEWYAMITLSTGTAVIFWLFLYWLHRQRIYLRL